MPNPTELTVHQKSRVLDVAYDDGSAYSIPFELMRVYSPSAEVKGHGPGQEVLQVGKRRERMGEPGTLLSIETVGWQDFGQQRVEPLEFAAVEVGTRLGRSGRVRHASIMRRA